MFENREGQKAPEVTFHTRRDHEWVNVTSDDIFKNRSVVLFALPGAFTPTCSMAHLPGFVALADKIKDKGVDAIACLSVNDAFVMDAWGKAEGVGEEIIMAADGNADFTAAIGMEVDASGFGLGTRSKRYAMVIEDGTVTTFLPEADGFSAAASLGSCVVDALKA